MIPAYRGEFGLKIRYHVPAVHSYLAKHPQPVQIERGEEALYPRATEHVVVDRADDDDRHGHPQFDHDGEQRFVPQPLERKGLSCDVLICPRGRSYGASKNWPHWHLLDHLNGVAAGGAPDSSQNVRCPVAWEHDRFLDATLELMLSARLIVATDSGLAHLAILSGKPLLLLTHRGAVAPGPVVDSTGRMVSEDYWPVRYSEYYAAANWRDAPIYVVFDAWETPESVLHSIAGILKRDSA